MEPQQNLRGGFFEKGKPVPNSIRKQIIYYHDEGLSQHRIASKVGVTQPTVGNIIHKYLACGDYTPRLQTRRQHVKLSLDVLKAMELYKYRKPSIYVKEMREQLVTDGVCTAETVPSLQYLNKVLKETLLHSYKKLSVVPMESQSADVQMRYDMYLDFISNTDPHSLHFFDESSVVQNTGNRRYGHALVCERAVELQKYTSRASFTVNLLHNMQGISHYSVIEGPSNGLELLQFFSDAMSATDDNGFHQLSHGDVVVMDNCGFHHGRNTEPQLRRMLAHRNITLVFQPPYHPHVNTCEFCFHQLKTFLRQNEDYSAQFTEMAIADGLLETITPAFSRQIYSHCGYI